MSFESLVADINAIKDKRYNNPQQYDCFSTWGQIVTAIDKVSCGLHSILGLRQYVTAVCRQLLPKMPEEQKKYQLELERGIDLLQHLETAIEHRRKPNLGQTFCRDFKGPDCLGKFMRYETQIERGLFRAMHELQRLQAVRSNQPVCQPVMVDVDISANPVGWQD